jgi:uncharacterized protein YuzE
MALSGHPEAMKIPASPTAPRHRCAATVTARGTNLQSKGGSRVKLSYDPRHNVAYLRFHDKTVEVQTIRISEDLNVDLAPDGTVYGVELLNANEQLRGDNGDFEVVNEASGESTLIPLAKG